MATGLPPQCGDQRSDSDCRRVGEAVVFERAGDRARVRCSRRDESGRRPERLLQPLPPEGDNQREHAAGATVTVDSTVDISFGAGTAKSSVVTVRYPFRFMVLQPVASLLVRGSTLGAPINITASSQMRNESQ